MLKTILSRIAAFLQSLPFLFYSNAELRLEIIVLKQQLAAFKREKPRPKLSRLDRIFWVCLRRVWKKWEDALFIVKPKTVVNWHKTVFKLYWNFISNRRKEKKQNNSWREARALVRKMTVDNETWGAPRIHGELLKLGFKLSERTVSRYMPKKEPSGDNLKKWMAFLKNHREGIAAMDFFTVPTLFFRNLYCFFIILHDKRRLVHFSVTFHPTAEWVSQQLKEAFVSVDGIKYMIHDRGTNFSSLVRETLKGLGIESVRTSYRSPWQNGIAERWVGSCRRELLDHLIVLNETHLLKLLEEYVRYYNEDRTHYNLDKHPPLGRPVLRRESDDDKVIALPRVNGLHHKYVWKKSA